MPGANDIIRMQLRMLSGTGKKKPKPKRKRKTAAKGKKKQRTKMERNWRFNTVEAEPASETPLGAVVADVIAEIETEATQEEKEERTVRLLTGSDNHIEDYVLKRVVAER